MQQGHRTWTQDAYHRAAVNFSVAVTNEVHRQEEAYMTERELAVSVMEKNREKFLQRLSHSRTSVLAETEILMFDEDQLLLLEQQEAMLRAQYPLSNLSESAELALGTYTLLGTLNHHLRQHVANRIDDAKSKISWATTMGIKDAEQTVSVKSDCLTATSVSTSETLLDMNHADAGAEAPLTNCAAACGNLAPRSPATVLVDAEQASNDPTHGGDTRLLKPEVKKGYRPFRTGSVRTDGAYLTPTVLPFGSPTPYYDSWGRQRAGCAAPAPPLSPNEKISPSSATATVADEASLITVSFSALQHGVVKREKIRELWLRLWPAAPQPNTRCTNQCTDVQEYASPRHAHVFPTLPILEAMERTLVFRREWEKERLCIKSAYVEEMCRRSNSSRTPSNLGQVQQQKRGRGRRSMAALQSATVASHENVSGELEEALASRQNIVGELRAEVEALDAQLEEKQRIINRLKVILQSEDVDPACGRGNEEVSSRNRDDGATAAPTPTEAASCPPERPQAHISGLLSHPRTLLAQRKRLRDACVEIQQQQQQQLRTPHSNLSETTTSTTAPSSTWNEQETIQLDQESESWNAQLQHYLWPQDFEAHISHALYGCVKPGATSRQLHQAVISADEITRLSASLSTGDLASFRPSSAVTHTTGGGADDNEAPCSGDTLSKENVATLSKGEAVQRTVVANNLMERVVALPSRLQGAILYVKGRGDIIVSSGHLSQSETAVNHPTH